MIKLVKPRFVCRSSRKPSFPCRDPNASARILQKINIYNNKILVIRNAITQLTGKQLNDKYDAIFYDQLEELYKALADLKIKIDETIETECIDI